MKSQEKLFDMCNVLFKKEGMDLAFLFLQIAYGKFYCLVYNYRWANSEQNIVNQFRN